jgi:precorrin-8X/cobalt-precorrin-8 methylmutase
MTTPVKAVVKRVIHTTGDPGILPAICFHPLAVSEGVQAGPQGIRALTVRDFHPLAVSEGVQAIRSGANLIADVNMLKSGINAPRLKAYGGEVICLISEPAVREAARDWGITRAAASMRILGDRLNNTIIAIGNAPTALFELLNMIEQKKCRPRLIIGTPVGFVGAAEAKELLINSCNVPYITVTGTRGGSAIAASVVNALLNFTGDL